MHKTEGRQATPRPTRLWRLRLALLLLLSVPAFTGYPLGMLGVDIVPGATWGWVLYWLVTTAALRWLNGRRRSAVILGISVLITLPVVFFGAGVSFLLALGSGPLGRLAFDYSPHYVAICVTMLTVVPLALSLAAAVPVQALEQRLLRGATVSPRGKALLMALRVFNHIVFFVIPTILEVVREESLDGRWAPHQTRARGIGALWRRCRRLVQSMILIATEGICSAVQFIPLWAVEISRLPSAEDERKQAGHGQAENMDDT